MDPHSLVQSEPLVDLQIALSAPKQTAIFLPDEADFCQWVQVCLPPEKSDYELTIRIVDIDESQSLNFQYRHKNNPTNVLSFPSTVPKEFNIPLLGDLVICAEVVNTEAREQGKTEMSHWAHMVVHGVLHLLGFDHVDEKDAIQMETLETKIITALGYSAPYGEIEQ